MLKFYVNVKFVPGFRILIVSKMAPIKVKVLETFGPSKFTVRPIAWEAKFHQLQTMMDEHFNYNATERNVANVAKGETVW